MKSLKTVLEEAGIWTNIAPQTDEPPTQDPIPGGIDIALAGEIKYYSEANHIFKDRKIAISDYYKNEIKYENGKYYMYIYPNDRCTYYAKMTINI